MAEFDDAREAYRGAGAATRQVRTELVRGRERIKRLQREIGGLERRAADEGDSGAQGRLAEAHRELAAAQGAERKLAIEFDAARDARIAAVGDFAAFTDPVEAVGRLPDHTPIALFPLRLETRFKTVDADGVPQQQLWVRVFPDDVLIDTFQPEISEAELANVTTYWTHRWRAGGDVAGHRAAWAPLVRSHGAGRAKWLIDRYAPLNLADEPVAGTNDHILVVRPAAPVLAAEQAPIAAFWERVWSSGGTERDAAYDDLQTALGPARAAEVEADLVPVNFHDVAVSPDAAHVPVVAFLDLPAPSGLPLSVDDWTRGATTWLLPERLVLLGFRDGAEVLREVGAPIPAELQVGPDPAAPDDEQVKADGEDIVFPDPMHWTIDFDAAVASGMGFRVNLSERDIAPPFDRLMVLGVRVGSDAQEGRAELGELIANHQASRKGCEILPQGRATNNTDADSSAYSWWVDPDGSFEHFFEADPADDPADWRRRKDGAWLAGLLGIDAEILRASPNYYGTDQAEARAMNVALWPATLGYYMEQMMEPVFDEDTVENTRDFFNRFVIGRGTLPLLRIGRQPYGIVPATAWSQLAWWRGGDDIDRLALRRRLPRPGFLDALAALIERGVSVWTTFAVRAAHVGEAGDDPQQTVLDILGLHPTSAEFYQRYSQSFTQYYNAMGFATEPVSEPLGAVAVRWIRAGLLALQELGWTRPQDGELPELLEKIFNKEANLLKGFLVEAELSETARLSVTRADGENYIAWLQSAARASHDTLRRQEGFTDGVPSALLYLMLKHALDLGFVDTGLALRRLALGWSDATYFAERREPKFIHIAGEESGSATASRWEQLYRAEPAVTGDAAQRLGDFIPSILALENPYLNRQLDALDVLKNASTAALERAFVEHIDCLSYRLDAWRLGLQAAQLSVMRAESSEGFGRDGIHLGAFGWLEDVAPAEGSLSPVKLDATLGPVFGRADEAPLAQDSANFGHIHAPSLDHAVTAAILRNGHLANATPEEPDLLAVDLSSERVRLAQYAIEGIRNGQSLGALLGYQLERALHDEPDLFLDRLIYDLRRAFPLAGNRLQRTQVSGLDSITTVEARNVVDGAAFMEHIADTGETSYPYGLGDLPPLTEFTGPGLPSAAQIGALIDGHVANMRSVGDAVGDLSLAEGVFQVVRGNYERAGGALDAFSKGTHPPEPEVTATPRRGKTLTCRVALHLRGGLLPVDPAPRAKGEPAIARWVESQLPAPATVFARVSWQDGAGATDGVLTPSMADLGLTPVDLFYLVDAGGARDMPGFDDLLIDFAVRNGAPAPRDDAVFTLEYKPAGVAGLTLFELAPLVRALRGTLLGARPLRPTDLSLQNEASGTEDASLLARSDKPAAVLADLQATRPAIDAFVTAVDAATADGLDPEVARDAARDNIDTWIDDYVASLRPVLPFGLRAASLTAASEGRRAPFTAMLQALDVVASRWEEKQTDYDGVMAEYAALPGTATDEERIALLVRAGRIVSTSVIATLPPAITMTALETDVQALRTSLDTGLTNLRALRDNAVRSGATLSAIEAFVPTMAQFDHAPFDLSAFRDSLLALAAELQQKAAFLRDDIDRRIATANAALADAAAASGEAAQAKVAEAAHTLLGEAFVVLPEFTVSAERLAEWDNAWGSRSAMLAHLQGGADGTPYPVDDWLHGTARVRERLRHLEQVGLFADALGAASEPVVEALQFPYRADDVWLGLEFPDAFGNGDPFVLDEDKLLYNAVFDAGAELDAMQPSQTYSGLLLDEWIEVVPADIETTGLAFHFNRPNAEAPQAILLATPPVFRGAWRFDDLVATLHETLDFARIRAVEPTQLEGTALAPLLPAVLSSVTTFPITAALDFSFNNQVYVAMQQSE